MIRLSFLCTLFLILSCSESEPLQNKYLSKEYEGKIVPPITTEIINGDPDDPAIWVNAEDPAQSIVLGTDKEGGVLYAFDLEGQIIKEKTITDLKTPNNVDIEYGFILDGKPIDIAVVTERAAKQLRVYKLPEMTPIDGGGLPVFTSAKGDSTQMPMGIALYKRPKDNTMWAFVSRMQGKSGEYVWQYFLEDDGTGQIRAILVRKFSKFSGHEDMEALVVDDEMGYVYVCDESRGIRKYYADPEKGNEELAFFGTEGFKEDQEGISIFPSDSAGGYIIVSDQMANRFQVFSRLGTKENPHDHPIINTIELVTTESDGSDLVRTPLNETFTKGIFVAMSDDKTFHFYRLEDLGL